jgi:FKBP-type peptidyl-prolyl cis-trans isomerase
LCYTSGNLGEKKFSVSQGGVESGLEEGILMLRVGDKARFIMPPHLAHGLLGDQKKIPPRAIIVYEVEITNISK